jgi:hypothetical protein
MCDSKLKDTLSLGEIVDDRTTYVEYNDLRKGTFEIFKKLVEPKVKECDNVSACHTTQVVGEDMCAQRVTCVTCKRQYVLRKSPWTGSSERRKNAEILRKDILQGHQNLFYKYNPQWLRK